MYSRPWQRTVSCLAAMSHDRADAASFIRSSSAIEHMRLSAPGLNAVEQSIVMNFGKAVRLCEPRDFSRREQSGVAYLCDRKAKCRDGLACGRECMHTFDITHAVNFYSLNDAFFEECEYGRNDGTEGLREN